MLTCLDEIRGPNDPEQIENGEPSAVVATMRDDGDPTLAGIGTGLIERLVQRETLAAFRLEVQGRQRRANDIRSGQSPSGAGPVRLDLKSSPLRSRHSERALFLDRGREPSHENAARRLSAGGAA
jgi:hypothetical protein